ncbi:hypothetical protein Ga0061079_1169 [Apibacter mensalis]|uniref:Uncharacterized protein n=1 Tax=Apibacter mensalis TaxID=1586267 RepID=A0A0X3ASR3_9FLAO|nr:hypothetical protein [Apibacter mensalis]CVK17107.1 hypothetical protein Ga0061079_1169 [Apibacter mensalis]
MITILKSIQKRINEIKEIAYVDEDWGQLDYYDTRPPVQWPCALITLNDGSFSNIGRDKNKTPSNRQQGIITLDITVANLKLTNTSFKSSSFQKDQGWDIWNLIEKIHEKLHGWKPDHKASGSLIRASCKSIRRNDAIQEIHIIYTLVLNNI